LALRGGPKNGHADKGKKSFLRKDRGKILKGGAVGKTKEDGPEDAHGKNLETKKQRPINKKKNSIAPTGDKSESVGQEKGPAGSRAWKVISKIARGEAAK